MSSCGLFDLPSSAAIVFLNQLSSVSNTGQVLRLALVCRASMQMVSSSDWYWQQQCEQLGWLRPGVYYPPRAGAPTNAHPQHQQQQEETPGKTQLEQQQQQQQQQRQQQRQNPTAAGPWFQYYTLRMSSRWRLRTLFKKYIPFLNIHSRLAMQPGASASALSAMEGRLGARLPWELWELYRFKGGQEPGQAVTFADSCRLLELHELSTFQISSPSTPSLAQDPDHQEQQLAALQRQIPALINLGHEQKMPGASDHDLDYGPGYDVDHDLDHDNIDHDLDHNLEQLDDVSNSLGQNFTDITCSGDSGLLGNSLQQQPQQDGHGGVASSAAAPPPPPLGDAVGTGGSFAAAAAAAAVGVVFLSNVTGSTSYCVSQDGSVRIIRGFTQRRVASSLAGFLQRLLT